jgi:diguanylate cyclase (GGDEF)-like protein
MRSVMLLGLMLLTLTTVTLAAALAAALHAAHAARRRAAFVRTLLTSPDPQRGVCEAAVRTARAQRAYLMLPDRQGEMVSCAAPVSEGLRRAAHMEETRHPLVDGERTLAVLHVVGARDPQALAPFMVEAAAALAHAEHLADLRVQARHDALTGIENRRAWDESMTGSLGQPGPLTVALLDLDHFKAYNDQHGHQAGDRLLKEAAATWRSLVRGSDMLARWGGEEFALLVHGCDAGEALSLIDRLRRSTPGGQTCSVGIAEWDGSEDADALLRRADAALYEAKRNGRDRVALSPTAAVPAGLLPGP